MRCDTDLILIEHMAARMRQGKARGMAVARKPVGGVPYRWAGNRLKERAEAAPPPFDGYVVHVPSVRRLGRLVGSILGGTPLQWVIVLLLLGLLGVAAIPLRSSSGGEAPSSEARAALGAMKDRARVVYQRTGKIPQNMAELDINRGELAGSEFQPADYVVLGGAANEWKAKCIGVYDSEPRDLVVTADLVRGGCTFNR